MKRKLVAFAGLCLLLAGSPLRGAESPGAVWPGYRGPRHDGTTGEQINLDQATLKQLWSVKLGKGVSSCAVVSNRLWTAGRAGGGLTVYALDTASGETVWERGLKVSRGNRIAIKGTKAGRKGAEAPHEERVYGSGGICATPFVTAGKVYMYSPEADAYCLSAETGEVLWERNLMADLPARSFHYGYCGSPIVAEGVFVVPIHLVAPPPGAFRKEEEGLVIRGGVLLALDAQTGKETWRNEMGACGWSTPTFAHLDGHDAIVQYSGTLVTGIDPANGNTLWHYDPLSAGLAMRGKEAAEVGAGPTVVGDCVLFPTHGFATTICIQVREGEARLRWVADAGNYLLNGAPAQGLWFVAAARNRGGGTRNSLHCIDIDTGGVCWEESLNPQGDVRPGKGCKGNGMMIAGDTLAVLTSSGELLLGKVSRDGFRQLARAAVGTGGRGGRGLHTPPVLCGGRAYVRIDGTLTAYRLDSGTLDATAGRGGMENRETAANPTRSTP